MGLNRLYPPSSPLSTYYVRLQHDPWKQENTIKWDPVKKMWVDSVRFIDCSVFSVFSVCLSGLKRFFIFLVCICASMWPEGSLVSLQCSKEVCSQQPAVSQG